MNPVDHAKLKQLYKEETGQDYPLCEKADRYNLREIEDMPIFCNDCNEHLGATLTIHGEEVTAEQAQNTLYYLQWLEELLINKI